MDCAAFTEQNTERNVCIVGSEPVENYTVYIIEVKVGAHRWTVKHRYSDFHELHEKLTSENKIDKHLLPPKKIIGKNSKTLVEKRQKELEVYLQTLLSRFPVAVPKVLSSFLHFQFYEISGITATLAEDLFHRGEQLLVGGEVFLLRPLQLYAITQQLKLAKPMCTNGDAKADLGHILDFACRLKYLKIPGTIGVVGTSNIAEHTLPFDLSVFKSVLQIEINDCSSSQIRGLPALKATLATLSIHRSAASMKEILVPEAAEFGQWEPEGLDIDCAVTTIIPTWKMLTTLDMSHNNICCVDESVKLIPAVEFLDLGHNFLSLVENLQYLYNLVHLDLSYNKLTVLEGVHTKLGNVKTLNLAGNQLETLSGLSKLYSLVNLDLSSNSLAQLDEIKHIGMLPCLEKLSLAKNPMCIIPDYRTKVLAQFCDRASEVCLDGTVTTEKEFDTVEVLKAIQKAKEVKDRMANIEKKISDAPRQTDTGLNPSSSSSVAVPMSSSCSSSSSSSSPVHCASSSQEIAYKDDAFRTKDILTHVDSTLTQQCFNNYPIACEVMPQVKTQLTTCSSSEIDSGQKHERSSCFYCEENQESWTTRFSTPVLPFWYLSYTTANLDFVSRLSDLVWQTDTKSKTSSEPNNSSVDVTEQGSPDSGGSYFEMGPDHTDEIIGCSSSSTFQDNESDTVESSDVQINLIMWSHCISVGPDGILNQMPCCLAATDRALVVFQTQSKETLHNLEELMDCINVALMVPYSDLETFGFDIPDICISLRLKSSVTRWYFFSDGQNLKEIHSHVNLLMDRTQSDCFREQTNVQLFIQQFPNSWANEKNDSGVKSGYIAHILDCASLVQRNQIHSVPSDILSPVHESQTSIPVILFLTTQNLCVLKVDFVAMASKPAGHCISSCAKFTRIPLASALLNPKQSGSGQSISVSHHFCDGHVLELMAGHEHLTVIFALPHDKFLFLKQFALFRANLQDIKTIALLQTNKRHLRVNSTTPNKTLHKKSVSQDMQKPHLTLSLLSPGDSLIQQLSDENQCPSHLSLSSALRHLSSLRGEEVIIFFHDNIAEVENEELKHILWTSVLFYKSPDMELTACLILSTKAVYFILDDVASTLCDQVMWAWHPSDHMDTDFLISFCFVMKLNELQSVNVGLFDQYFRVVGPSPEHIISCLTRDSYSTHHFLQQLMSVLSLLEKAPSPEPSDHDFYTQFGKKSTGKMENYELVHSSRVKFVYPSEEEIGDLTFIAAERKGPHGAAHSFNILFYALVFQVQSVPGAKAELQPKSLVLSSTHVFLLDEDYISYPLPQFAKEPPQRDKYRLIDARRIRDLDRVLMGYQPYPQALTFVFDDVPGPDLLCHLTMDHFSDEKERKRLQGGEGAESEVQWCIFVPGADSRERLISLVARQWEMLCSRELPLELTG